VLLRWAVNERCIAQPRVRDDGDAPLVQDMRLSPVGSHLVTIAAQAQPKARAGERDP
jgi:hypothetical protein